MFVSWKKNVRKTKSTEGISLQLIPKLIKKKKKERKSVKNGFCGLLPCFVTCIASSSATTHFTRIYVSVRDAATRVAYVARHPLSRGTSSPPDVTITGPYAANIRLQLLTRYIQICRCMLHLKAHAWELLPIDRFCNYHPHLLVQRRALLLGVVMR